MDEMNPMLVFDYTEICRYHHEKCGVICDQRKITDYDCAHCGWNTQVARNRAYKIREERRKLNAGDPV